MRKIFPYILIVLILVQLFSPFTVGLGIKNNLEVKSSKAEAADTLSLTTYQPYAESTGLFVAIRTVWVTTFWNSDPDVSVILLDKTGKVVDFQNLEFTKTEDISLGTTEEKNLGGVDATKIVKGGSVHFSPLTPSTNYDIKIVVTTSGNSFVVHFVKGVLFPVDELKTLTTTDPKTMSYTITDISTLPKGTTGVIKLEQGVIQNEDTLLPICTLGNWSIGSCVGIFLYKIIFQPTSFLFGLTGKLLDISVAYSVKSSSYTSSFVTEGWGVIRDLCNMFFIFVLLYIAFGTILGLHGVKTKEMIINVVIIGLLMNFSLFAAQVIIDASNIMTRVFYNSNSIKIGTTLPGGKFQEELGTQNEIKLSEALIAKINPQRLLMNASKVDNIQTNKTLTSTTESKTGSGVSASTFILVTILASIVNIVGLITFLFCALLFVTRVIGLWLAMIFSPLAFFSYTVPAMQEWEMVGWKKWWPETLKLAFLAPVFVFFMYLIIKFLDTGLGLAITDQKDGMDFLLGIFIPFIFIMVLLNKAKSIASDMSGKMGQSITNGLAAVGGIALGGAALGTAALLRKGVGGTLAMTSRGDTATQKYKEAMRLKEIDGGAALKKLTLSQKVRGFTGSKMGLGKLYGEDKGEVDAKGNKIGVTGGIGGLLNKKQKDVGDVDHARHTLDEVTKSAGVIGPDGEALKLNEMTGTDLTKVKNKFNETKRSETESAVKKGFDSKGAILLEEKDAQGNIIARHQGEEAYKAARRHAIITEVRNAAEPGDVDFDGELTDSGKKKVENKLNVELNAAIKIATDNKLSQNFSHLKEEASTQVNPLTRGFAGVNKNSFDLRKLSDLKSDKRESALFSKVPMALIAGIATGVRAGMKNVGVSNGGIKVQGDFMKDLGNTISDSLKNMKVNVDLSHVGEHKSSADAHGGDGGHH